MKGTDETPRLPSAKVTRTVPFELAPDAGMRAALADSMGILGIKKLTFTGEIGPDGNKDLVLNGHLGATVVQSCVVTLEPVTTRIDEPVARRYVAGYEMPEDAEVEMPEDESVEALPVEIDLAAVMAEALALNLPAWPRADGVAPVEIAVTEPGKVPMTDDDTKPFAALKSLKDKLGQTPDE
ncbi:MAG: DUF177 domain-containing protein [Silicimonas sp.]|nr:DUF177 domain-containing protein [Silicimonas sp.]